MDLLERLMAPVQKFSFDNPPVITELMYMIWWDQQGLQRAYPLDTYSNRVAYAAWFWLQGGHRYNIDKCFLTESFPLNHTGVKLGVCVVLLRALRAMANLIRPFYVRLPRQERNAAKSVYRKLEFSLLELAVRWTPLIHWNRNKEHALRGERHVSSAGGVKLAKGVNLVGYARTESGLGEHIRMVARALKTQAVQMSVINYEHLIWHRKKDNSIDTLLAQDNPYRANVFHINADAMLQAFGKLGLDFFRRRYNIGYWAWELATCPDAWLPVCHLVDEIWAPSMFILRAFKKRVTIPVIHMPLCVSFNLQRKYTRSEFGLKEDSYLFLLVFDFYSHVARKNPLACIEAFRRAFPHGNERAGLVIKTHNAHPRDVGWDPILDRIQGDHRIVIINQTWDRERLMGLVDVCDSFVSLHRSEGFGRGPAEAMLLGKPVIVTNYSGNTDFTLADNSCLVDYKLVPVRAGEYVFEQDQWWADPDVDQAARYMKKLVEDPEYGHQLGAAAQYHINRHFNPIVIGNSYIKRLKALGLVD